MATTKVSELWKQQQNVVYFVGLNSALVIGKWMFVVLMVFNNNTVYIITNEWVFISTEHFFSLHAQLKITYFHFIHILCGERSAVISRYFRLILVVVLMLYVLNCCWIFTRATRDIINFLILHFNTVSVAAACFFRISCGRRASVKNGKVLSTFFLLHK